MLNEANAVFRIVAEGIRAKGRQRAVAVGVVAEDAAGGAELVVGLVGGPGGGSERVVEGRWFGFESSCCQSRRS